MNTLSRSTLPLLLVMLLCGCAAEPLRPAPAPLAVGLTLAEVAALHETDAGPPLLAMLDGPRHITVFGADANGRVAEWSTMMPAMPRALVFEDDRYLATLDAGQALEHTGCLLRADGPRLLASRLRALAAGRPDPAAQLRAVDGAADLDGPLDCPWTPRIDPGGPAAVAADAPMTAAEKAGAVGGLLLLPFLAIGDLMDAGVRSVGERSVLERQRALQLGSGELEIVHLLGTPSDGYDVARPGELRILHYRRRAIHDLLIGLRNERAEWFLAESGVNVLDAWSSLGKPAAADDDRR